MNNSIKITFNREAVLQAQQMIQKDTEPNQTKHTKSIKKFQSINQESVLQSHSSSSESDSNIKENNFREDGEIGDQTGSSSSEQDVASATDDDEDDGSSSDSSSSSVSTLDSCDSDAEASVDFSSSKDPKISHSNPSKMSPSLEKPNPATTIKMTHKSKSIKPYRTSSKSVRVTTNKKSASPTRSVAITTSTDEQIQEGVEVEWRLDCPCGVSGDNLDDGSCMIACDQCEVWQHMRCVGISPEKAPQKYYCQNCESKKISIAKSSQAKIRRNSAKTNGTTNPIKKTQTKFALTDPVNSFETSEETWTVDCLCGIKEQNYDDGKRMIACDRCEIWQHTDCVGIDIFEEPPVHYQCSQCQNKDKHHRRKTKPLKSKSVSSSSSAHKGKTSSKNKDKTKSSTKITKHSSIDSQTHTKTSKGIKTHEDAEAAAALSSLHSGSPRISTDKDKKAEDEIDYSSSSSSSSGSSSSTSSSSSSEEDGDSHDTEIPVSKSYRNNILPPVVDQDVDSCPSRVELDKENELKSSESEEWTDHHSMDGDHEENHKKNPLQMSSQSKHSKSLSMKSSHGSNSNRQSSKQSQLSNKRRPSKSKPKTVRERLGKKLRTVGGVGKT